MRGNTIHRIITGDKAGIIKALREHQSYIKDCKANAHITLRKQAEYGGQDTGLEFAIHMLEDWQDASLSSLLETVAEQARKRCGDIEAITSELQKQIEGYPKGDRYIAGVMDRRTALWNQRVALAKLFQACTDAAQFELDKPVKES